MTRLPTGEEKRNSKRIGKLRFKSRWDLPAEVGISSPGLFLCSNSAFVEITKK